MNENPTPAADPARGRFWLIQLTRLSGIVFMLAGLAVLTGKVDLPRAAGVVLLLVGAGVVIAIVRRKRPAAKLPTDDRQEW